MEDLFERIRQAPIGITRSELAAESSMSRSGVTYLVQRLLMHGRVVETVTDPGGKGSGSGRPAKRLMTVASKGWVAGIDFGHKHIYVAVADSAGNEIASCRVLMNVDLNARQAMDEASTLLRSLCREQGIDQLTSIAAGIPGPIDAQRAVVRSPTILSGWVGLDPAAELAERFGQAVLVENDAVLGAIGENTIGAARGLTDFLYVKISDGIGAALVLNGRIYKGAVGLAGEIGHNRLENNNELCRCGSRGCLEAVISVSSVMTQLAHSHEGVTIDAIDALPFTDDVTDRIFRDAGRTVGQALSTLCNLLNPGQLVIGGKLGTAHPEILTGIRLGIDQFAQPATAEAMTIEAAAHGCRAELMGALQLAARPSLASK